MKSVVRILVLLAVATVAGAVNATWRGLPWKVDAAAAQQHVETLDKVGKRHKELREKVGITLEGLKTAMQQGVVIIDARPHEEFEKGHLAYDFNPPVLNVEPDKVGENLERLNALAGQSLIIYCTSDDCTLGEELYLALEPYNPFFDTKIFFPGWEGLQAAKMPEATGHDNWQPAEMGGAAGAGDSGAEDPSADPNGGEANGGGDGGEEHP